MHLPAGDYLGGLAMRTRRDRSARLLRTWRWRRRCSVAASAGGRSMYKDVAQWRRIRRRVLAGGVSQSQIAREMGMAQKTIRKMIESPIPPEFRRMKPITGTTKWPCLGLIEQILKEDQGKPKRQQHT